MNKEIEEMAKVIEEARIKAQGTLGSLNNGVGNWYAKALAEAGYGAIKKYEEKIAKLQKECDDKERYTFELYSRARQAEEEVKSLQKHITNFKDFGKMTTPVGLLPVNVEGMRTLVDSCSALQKQAVKDFVEKLKGFSVKVKGVDVIALSLIDIIFSEIYEWEDTIKKVESMTVSWLSQEHLTEPDKTSIVIKCKKLTVTDKEMKVDFNEKEDFNKFDSIVVEGVKFVRKVDKNEEETNKK